MPGTLLINFFLVLKQRAAIWEQQGVCVGYLLCLPSAAAKIHLRNCLWGLSLHAPCALHRCDMRSSISCTLIPAGVLSAAGARKRFPLLSPTLEGLARFAHLISVDYFGDLMQVSTDSGQSLNACSVL